MALDNQTRRIVVHRLSHLVPGMEAAQDVCTPEGTVLVSAGAILNSQTIEKMRNWSVEKVPVFAEVEINPLINPQIKKFIHNYNNSVQAVERAFDLIRSSEQVPVAAFEKTAQAITADVRTVGNALDQLYNLPPCDDYTFRHCVNVSIIAAMIAMWLKYPADIVNAISLTGLMHDIGKSHLPVRILNKPYKLEAEDYEHYKQHTMFGEQLLRKTTGIAESVIAGVVQHHEREDGSGYPHGLASGQIHLYAKIVAIADLYDEELTINFDPSMAVSPYVSLEKLRDAIYKLDARACLIFTQNMTNYLSGNIVKLTDGRQGRVVCINADRPSLSMVQLENGEILDLADQAALRIQHLVR